MGSDSVGTASRVRGLSVVAERCHGCQTCMLACSLSHEGQCHLGLARVRVRKDMQRFLFEIRVCRHCESPECLAACPTGALSLDERGVVVMDDGICTRCGLCFDACPYDAIFYNQEEDRYLKCDLCAGRAEGPLCAALCPTGALTVGGAVAEGEV